MQRIPDDLSIFTAQAKAIDLALDLISISFHFILQIFTFSIHIMFSLIPSDSNDPQGLMRR